MKNKLASNTHPVKDNSANSDNFVTPSDSASNQAVNGFPRVLNGFKIWNENAEYIIQETGGAIDKEVRLACPHCNDGSKHLAVNRDKDGGLLYNCNKCESVHGKIHPEQNGGSYTAKTSAPEKKTVDLFEYILSQTTPAKDDHPYLKRKGIENAASYGIRQGEYKGVDLLYVLFHNSKGELTAIQRISPNGEKRFIKDSKKTGASSVIGTIENGKPIYFTEGYANAVTTRKAGFSPAVSCADAGNMPLVIELYRQKNPDSPFIIVADNDDHKKGIIKAIEAAKAAGNTLICMSDIQKEDINDVMVNRGLDAVKEIIEAPKDAEFFIKKYALEIEDQGAAVSANTEGHDTESDGIIIYKSLQLHEQQDLSADALRAWNQEHCRIFELNGKPIVFQDGKPLPLTKPKIKELLTRAAKHTDNTVKKWRSFEPSASVAANLLQSPELYALHIERFSLFPFFTADGVFVCKPGYDEKTSSYLSFTGNVNADMSIKDSKAALDDFWADIRFESPVDRVNADAGLIAPQVADMCKGIPHILVHAPQQSSGKTKVTNALCYSYIGDDMKEVGDWKNNDEKLEKDLVTHFKTGSVSHLSFDNLKTNPINSAILDTAAGTIFNQTFRLLGGNESLSAPLCRTLRIFNANNPTMDKDFVIRCLPIRLNPRCSKPDDRNDFKHPDFDKHLRESRDTVLSACASLVKAWIDGGMKEGRIETSKFRPFCAVMAGILENAGYQGFWSNRKALYESASKDDSAIEELLKLWIAENSGGALPCSDILGLIKNNFIDLPVERKTDRAKIIAAGKICEQYEGRYFSINGAEYTIEKSSHVSKKKAFCLRLRSNAPESFTENGDSGKIPALSVHEYQGFPESQEKPESFRGKKFLKNLSDNQGCITENEEKNPWNLPEIPEIPGTPDNSGLNAPESMPESQESEKIPAEKYPVCQRCDHRRGEKCFRDSKIGNLISIASMNCTAVIECGDMGGCDCFRNGQCFYGLSDSAEKGLSIDDIITNGCPLDNTMN